MFKLIICDRTGVELNEGDFVKISNGKDYTFYSEVKYIPEKKVLVPFDNFCFHSFEKVDSIPKDALKASSEDGYDYFYHTDPEKDENGETFKNYLISYSGLSDLIESRTYKIEKIIDA